MGQSSYYGRRRFIYFEYHIPALFFIYLFADVKEEEKKIGEEEEEKTRKGQPGQWSRNAACAPGPTGPTTF